MRIGIDVSQLSYQNTGVANYLENLVRELLETDPNNEYVLFFSSLRRNFPQSSLKIVNNPKVKVKKFRIPPTLLDLLWNKLHIMPIEWFVGPVDLFITSDWTEPPTKKAKKATIIYDTIIYKYPQETHQKIIGAQKRKLKWVKKESNLVFTISQSSKKDIEDILGIDSSKIQVIYPGI